MPHYRLHSGQRRRDGSSRLEDGCTQTRKSSTLRGKLTDWRTVFRAQDERKSRFVRSHEPPGPWFTLGTDRDVLVDAQRTLVEPHSLNRLSGPERNVWAKRRSPRLRFGSCAPAAARESRPFLSARLFGSLTSHGKKALSWSGCSTRSQAGRPLTKALRPPTRTRSGDRPSPAGPSSKVAVAVGPGTTAFTPLS